MRLEVLMEKKNRKRYSLLLVMLMLTCLIWNLSLIHILADSLFLNRWRFIWKRSMEWIK